MGGVISLIVLEVGFYTPLGNSGTWKALCRFNKALSANSRQLSAIVVSSPKLKADGV